MDVSRAGGRYLRHQVVAGADEYTTVLKSYRYLRTAMVALVLCLTAAVTMQSLVQGSILSSISAYYYTPAQAIFVGVLVAIGVCMIALKGTTEVEDILLNIGGMLAPVVAIVPTARGVDYAAALQACTSSESATEQGLATDDCPTTMALQEATEANVANNMTALLVVGAVGLLVAVAFRLLDRDSDTSRVARMTRIGIAATAVVYAATASGFLAFRQAFLETAHYVAAVAMFGCIVVVAVVNALRHRNEDLARLDTFWAKAVRSLTVLFLSFDRYAMVALAMVVAVVVGAPLALLDAFDDTVFWLEAALIILFAVFWVVQTVERWHQDAGAPLVGDGAVGSPEEVTVDSSRQ